MINCDGRIILRGGYRPDCMAHPTVRSVNDLVHPYFYLPVKQGRDHHVFYNVMTQAVERTSDTLFTALQSCNSVVYELLKLCGIESDRICYASRQLDRSVLKQKSE